MRVLINGPEHRTDLCSFFILVAKVLRPTPKRDPKTGRFLKKEAA